jgi:hypothetical protein
VKNSKPYTSLLISPCCVYFPEGKVAAVQNLASYSPKALCGFDPCQRVGCLEEKGAICVTDFDCNPTFFDDEGNVLKRCKGNERATSGSALVPVESYSRYTTPSMFFLHSSSATVPATTGSEEMFVQSLFFRQM